MRITLLLASAAGLLLAGCDTSNEASMARVKYPETRRDDVVERYHGESVTDPYRWLETIDAPETAAWVADQNAIAEPFLEAIPQRQAIIERLTALWNFERFSVPQQHGGRYFYTRNDGLQNHSVLYVADSIGAPGRVLLDPNTFSEDGTTSLSQYMPSPDGKLLAYSVSDGGSDWNQWRVRNVASGEDLPDLLLHTKFTGASWSRDSSGFYYSRYPLSQNGVADDSKAVSVYYHAVGTSQANDTLVYALPEHERWNPYATVSEDGKYLVITIWEGYFENAVHYMTLDEGSGPAIELLADWDALYQYLGNVDGEFYFKTTNGAPNGRVIAIDVEQPERANWREVAPEQPQVLESASMVGGHVIAQYLEDARSRVRLLDLAGTPIRDVELPGPGSVSGFGGEMTDTHTFFEFTSFTVPGAIYHYDIASGETTLFRRANVDAELDAFETQQVFFASKDGTRVPMFIIHRKDIELDGTNPTLLYGYGGFGVSMTPYFSISRTVWLEMGGVLAIANLRGGGEYGEAWHRAGTKLQKQNVFDDFIAAAETLIRLGYTSADKLAVQGGSNGGTLVGAVINQRPELFAAALPGVGVMDMLRYHTASANAYAWSSDYGTSEDPEQFRALLAYSPLHNVEPGNCYPATLITTADRDDRVVPWHSYKYAAAMQAAQSSASDCENPILIRVETRAGHGAGKPTWMIIENIADQWAFLAEALNMDLHIGDDM